MQNPIIQALKQNNSKMLNNLDIMRALLSGQSPEVIYNDLMRNDPKFRQFVEDNKGKTPEEIALAYDIDPALLK